jgi:CHAD domain-containing protein
LALEWFLLRGWAHGDDSFVLLATRGTHRGWCGPGGCIVTAERKVRLIPSSGFQMPALDGLPEGFVAVPRPVHEFDATYYDTSDLELARWGITLRHRGDVSGRPWTLKLPEHSSGVLITREELGFDGSLDAVPAEACDLVRGFTRGRQLIRVARLHTNRVRVGVEDANRQVLIEVVDDSVSVLVGARKLDSFREVEVEVAVDTPSSRATLRSAVALLVEAGCRAERPIPKLVRALGQRAQEPPSVVVVSVDRQSSMAELVCHVTAYSVKQIVMNDAGVRLGRDPEAVHRYRVAARRLRSDLRTFDRFLEDGPAGRLRDELSWLGGAVGPVRDLDVLGARFVGHSSGLPDEDQAAASKLLARVWASRRDARDELLEAMRSERYDSVLRALVEFASGPPLGRDFKHESTRPAAGPARRLVKRRWKQLAATVEAVGEDPSDEELHRIRIAAKRCRYAAEAVAPVVGRRASRFAAGVEEVQTVLGDYHDTVVAEAWLRDAAARLVDCRVVIGGLIAIERQERARLREAWPAAWHLASRREARAWF